MLLKTLRDLGKKGGFYRSPQKLAVAGSLDWRLRCNWVENSGAGRRLRPTPVFLRTGHHRRATLLVMRTDRRFRSRGAGDSGQTGDSGNLTVSLRTGVQCRTTARQRSEKNLRSENPGPVDRRLRTISGVPPDPYPESHHKKVTWQQKAMDRRLRVLWAGDSGGTGHSGPSPDQIQTVKPELP